MSVVLVSSTKLDLLDRITSSMAETPRPLPRQSLGIGSVSFSALPMLELTGQTESFAELMEETIERVMKETVVRVMGVVMPKLHALE